jgi:DNA-binding MarR family transcriptional regulator
MRKHPKMTKGEFEQLADFRYQLRRFLRFSEEVAHSHGITSLQYLLMLQIKGFPNRDWATVGELAERLQAKHHGVVSLISRCEAIGLVRRSVNANDRRCVEVKLTRKGEQWLERLALLHRVELQSLKGSFVVPDVTQHLPRSRLAKTKDA